MCKWRIIYFIHSGADQLYSDVRYRTLSIVKSTVSPHFQDREASDAFSWVTLTPVFGSSNRGDDATWTQMLWFAA